MTALQRDTVRTRRALLDAAGRAVIAKGPAVSLEVVAREAGVSKGGLLHHFRTRDELLLAVAEDWIQRFDETVRGHLDPDDDTPGRWGRAHIRAAFDPSISGGTWLHAAVQAALLSTPGFLQQARTSADRWQREMESDGLHPDRALLVARALDGDAMNDLFEGTQDDAARNRLRELLLALTEDPGPLIHPRLDT